jgi:hypothetical protein
MVPVAVVTAMVTLRPKVLRAPLWRATVTPLASIIGSGFLISGPILAHVAGNWAWAAMGGLCLAAYLFGAVIRANILTVEAMMDGHPPAAVAVLEHASDFALAFAYFVSVTYYLNLLVAFGLRADAIIDPHLTRIIASVIICALGVIGAFGGLIALEGIETTSVGVKLALIAGLIAALAYAFAAALGTGHLQLPMPPHASGFHEFGILLGLLILVQGFETSRYLGEAYDRATRVKTMRYAQLLSALIYIVFILLITPYFTGRLPAKGGETAIIDMLAPLGAMTAPLIIVAALASQLSAAVADMNGASGLLVSATKRRVSTGVGYLLIAAVALVITWTADIFEIIVYASKAFALYYTLQAGLAALVAIRPGPQRHWGRAALFGAGVALGLAVLVLGVSAEGG